MSPPKRVWRSGVYAIHDILREIREWLLRQLDDGK